MSKDIFSQIRDNESPADIVFKNEYVTAFKDISPITPVHIIIIPNTKYATLNDINEESVPYLGNMLLAASKIAKQSNIAEDGYRIILNCNKNGGQDVYYIHIHLLGGCKLGRILSLPKESKKFIKELKTN